MQICFGFIQFTKTAATHFFHIFHSFSMCVSPLPWCFLSLVGAALVTSRSLDSCLMAAAPENLQMHTHNSTAEWQKTDTNCKHLVFSMSIEYEQTCMLPGSGLLLASSSDRLSPGRVEGVWPEVWYSSSWASSSSIRSCNSYNTHTDIDMNLSETV